MQNSNRVLGAGTPHFDRLYITLASGVKVDLVPHLIQMNIYEDIFSPVLTGDITILDNRGMFDSEPLNGTETITTNIFNEDYSKDNLELNFLFRTFDVFAISNVQNKTDYSKIYTLHFASPEFKKNETTRISKAWRGVTLSHIVSSVMTGDYDVEEPNGLGFPTEKTVDQIELNLKSPFIYGQHIESAYKKSDELDKVELFIEKTKYIEPIVSFPYMTPFDIINWCANRSLRLCPGRDFKNDDSESANFLFFENKRGFQFVSLETLLESKDYKLTKFVYGDTAQNTSDPRRIDTETIEKYEIQSCHDNIAGIRNGLYASRMYTYDISTGQTKINDYNYLEEFGKTESTESGKPDNYPVIPKNSKLATNFMGNRMFTIVSPNRFSDPISGASTMRRTTNKEECGPEEYLQKRISQLARLNNYRLLFQIAGNTKHKVGDVPYIQMNRMYPGEGTAFSDFTIGESKYYSGYYLITSIRHMYTKSEYKMHIEAVKDAHPHEIEGPLENE